MGAGMPVGGNVLPACSQDRVSGNACIRSDSEGRFIPSGLLAVSDTDNLDNDSPDFDCIDLSCEELELGVPPQLYREGTYDQFSTDRVPQGLYEQSGHSLFVIDHLIAWE